MAFVGRDFFREPLSAAELDELLRRRAAADLFSWQSPSARRLAVSPATAGVSELRALMLEEPRLLRRPLLRLGNRLLAGFKAAEWQRELLVREEWKGASWGATGE